jgi:hypothetical protein
MSTLVITRGDTSAWEFTVTDEEGNSQDISGAVPRMAVKVARTDADADAVLMASLGNGKAVLTDELNGLVTVTFTAADTDVLDVGVYAWDLQLVDSGQAVYTVDRGRLTVQGDVTRTVP